MSWKEDSQGTHVSVAGCLGYDVLEIEKKLRAVFSKVSVAGCLGYDVLDQSTNVGATETKFQLLVV